MANPGNKQSATVVLRLLYGVPRLHYDYSPAYTDNATYDTIDNHDKLRYTGEHYINATARQGIAIPVVPVVRGYATDSAGGCVYVPNSAAT